MAVAWLTQADLNAFRRRPPDDPAVIADRKIRRFAEEQGGEVLAYWRWALGRIWDDPVMMTGDEVSKRLDIPEDRLEAIRRQTMKACGYGKAAPE